MKHATAKTLHAIPLLLHSLRQDPQLKERKLGIFYQKSKPFLHFHEDSTPGPATAPALFAHLKTPTGWKRLPINSPQQKRALQNLIQSILAQ